MVCGRKILATALLHWNCLLYTEEENVITLTVLRSSIEVAKHKSVSFSLLSISASFKWEWSYFIRPMDFLSKITWIFKRLTCKRKTRGVICSSSTVFLHPFSICLSVDLYAFLFSNNFSSVHYSAFCSSF